MGQLSEAERNASWPWGVREPAGDGSWSSREAEEILRRSGETYRSAGVQVDAVAASLVLGRLLYSEPADPV